MITKRGKKKKKNLESSEKFQCRQSRVLPKISVKRFTDLVFIHSPRREFGFGLGTTSYKPTTKSPPNLRFTVSGDDLGTVNYMSTCWFTFVWGWDLFRGKGFLLVPLVKVKIPSLLQILLYNRNVWEQKLRFVEITWNLGVV